METFQSFGASGLRSFVSMFDVMCQNNIIEFSVYISYTKSLLFDHFGGGSNTISVTP